MLFENKVRPEGFEPSTTGAEIRYSIQLNYGRKKCANLIILFLYGNKKNKTITAFIDEALKKGSLILKSG